ncbi:Hypp4624 [Branchiostoma lanceolatum]|uniref:Hypp4624 protein n=1 Tax=Branchiostoma lanceolatum TaxID=7740 RepID=A0A8K0AAV8_BRALA|nr:Hypp4624 [Branchiostoma lanceolatum]
MTTLNPILTAVAFEVVFKMATTSTTPALPICPSGYGWDSQLEDCLPYSLCDTAPDTSICSDLSRSAGYGWNQYLEDCQACCVCDEAPNTSICPYCHTAGDKELKTGIQETPKTGIQETADGEMSSGNEEVLDRVTVI